MNPLTPIQARVIGCLMEKKETTPDQYPLTLNALRNACNQKTSRIPVTSYSEGEVGHALRELEGLKWVAEVWGSRVARYEHRVPQVLQLHSKGMALISTLMLRGPQTLGELKNHCHRMFEFDDLDDVHYALQKLMEHEPALVMELPRQPGQKEGRFSHLLCGVPDIPEPAQAATPAPSRVTGRQSVSSASPFEEIGGFCRAVRVGNVIHVAGTAPIGPDGKTFAPGNAAAQAERCFEIAITALRELGSGVDDVTRTRLMVTHIEDWQDITRVHGEFFGDVRPACTLVQVAGLIDPDWRIEIEVDAVTG